MIERHSKVFVPVSVDVRLPKSFATIHVVLLDGRLPMMAQWRPSESGGEWWTLGMANATRIEEKKKCVTHWLGEKNNCYVLTEQELKRWTTDFFLLVVESKRQ